MNNPTNEELLIRAMAPKSDQLNADDLVAGPKNITITHVKVLASPEQPISIFYHDDAGKPWKPSKGMMRVLSYCWGADPDKWAGRSATLYNDPDVTFGKDKTGGIRISHLSHITAPVKCMVTLKRSQRKPMTVLPFAAPAPKQAAPQGQAPDNTLKILAQRLKDASLHGVKPLEIAWDQMPEQHRPTLQNFYNERYVSAQQIDYEKSQVPKGFTPTQISDPLDSLIATIDDDNLEPMSDSDYSDV